MGTYRLGYASAEQMAQIQIASDQIRATAGNVVHAPKGFIYIAGFDGSNNDRENLSLSGTEYQTNVANIIDQVASASLYDSNVGCDYFRGVGAGGDSGNLWNAAFAPTVPIVETAETALAKFAKQAAEYLNNTPDATYANLSASFVCFSRGCTTGAIFSHLIEERGLVAADGTVIAPPGAIKVYSPAIIESVPTFVDADISLSGNIVGPILVVKALNETRQDFGLTDYSSDSRVLTIEIPGNHVGSGGGYDQHGTGAAVLESITSFWQRNGVPVADVPEDKRFDPTKPVALYTEAYQTAANGDLVRDENGNPVKIWRTSPDGAPRHRGGRHRSGIRYTARWLPLRDRRRRYL